MFEPQLTVLLEKREYFSSIGNLPKILEGWFCKSTFSTFRHLDTWQLFVVKFI